MANMPFKMSYSFEGNCRNRPEQNLSGASRKETREVLLHRAQEERLKRQEQRIKFKSALTIQSYCRSYLIRKRKKQEERLKFDENESKLDVKPLTGRLLFFYDSKTDKERLFRVSHQLLHYASEILQTMDFDTSLNWNIKRFLYLCLNELLTEELRKLSLQCIDVFTENPNSKTKLEILPYLVNKGYYRQLRRFLDSHNTEEDQILVLIGRPFKLIASLSSSRDVDIILSEFCNNFLCPRITPKVKTTVLPYLQKFHKFPFNDIIRFLNESHNYDATNSLLYCVLALEPLDYVPTQESIQVLAALSMNMYQLFKMEIDLSEDSDSEEMDVDVSVEHVSIQDYIHLLNNADRVKRIILYLEEHLNNEELLSSIIKLCHNLLLTYKDSIRKFMLLFMLALKGKFLNKLWQTIKKRDTSFLHMTGSLGQWQDIHVSISVFCDMFTFYTETLTDSETSDTSATFSSSDLSLMSELLKNMALNLIEFAFPMCRSSSFPATPELLHLYTSCLNCVKKLYMLDLRKNFCKSGFWTRKKIHISQDLSRKNYLSKTIKPFYGLVSENEDEHLPPLSTIEQRSLAILQQLPFLIEFNNRVLLLRDLCRYSLGDSEMRLHREFLSDNAIVIRRTHLYEDAFEKLSRENESDLRQRIRIQFINSVGLEEAGIDGGGIFKEFINEVSKTSFDPNRGFFLLTNDNMLYPNPNVGALVENYSEHYYFIGRLVGKAIFENILVDLPLAEFFLVKLLVDRANAHYLKSLDPVLYRNLLYLRDYQGDVQDLGLDFTTISNDLGETKVMELKPNGQHIPVTNYNRLEYIHRLADLKLNTQIRRQCLAFREGLDSVVPLLWLRLFNHHELQVILSGDTQEMDINDLRAHTAYGGEFRADHPTVLLFWKIVYKFTASQKKQLLKFVTSCSRPPLLGFKELNPPFCIQSSGTEDRMPTASTCLNLLKIPIMKEEEALQNKLLSAIEQQAGFELS